MYSSPTVAELKLLLIQSYIHVFFLIFIVLSSSSSSISIVVISSRIIRIISISIGSMITINIPTVFAIVTEHSFDVIT